MCNVIFSPKNGESENYHVNMSLMQTSWSSQIKQERETVHSWAGVTACNGPVVVVVVVDDDDDDDDDDIIMTMIMIVYHH